MYNAYAEELGFFLDYSYIMYIFGSIFLVIAAASSEEVFPAGVFVAGVLHIAAVAQADAWEPDHERQVQ